MGKSLLLSVIASCLLLSTGCQSLTGTSADPDPRLQKSEINVDNSSYATGCIVGAGAGLLICALSGSDNASCYAAAAMAGCGAGLLGNALLDNMRQNYATREQQLDALAEYIERNNQQASQMANAAQQVYKEDKQRLAQVQKDIVSGNIASKDVEYTIARYNANIKLLQENIAGHEQSLATYRQTRQGIVDEAKGRLNAAERRELAECDRKIASLQRDIEAIRSVCANFIHDRDVLNLAANNMQIKAAG